MTDFGRILRNLGRFKSLVAVGLISTSTVAFAATPSQNPCHKALSQIKITPQIGRPVDSTTTLLGHGKRGGHVFLVHPVSGAAYVKKVYLTPEYYNNDKLAFEIMQEIFRRSPTLDWSLINILDQNDSTSTMLLEWIPGQTLEFKTEEARVNHHPRTYGDLVSLSVEYGEILAQGVQALETEGWRNLKIVSLKPNIADHIKAEVQITLDSGAVVLVNLLAKPDNVVIQDRPRRLVIIDPF